MKGRALFTRGPLASGCIAKIDRFVEQLLKDSRAFFHRPSTSWLRLGAGDSGRNTPFYGR